MFCTQTIPTHVLPRTIKRLDLAPPRPLWVRSPPSPQSSMPPPTLGAASSTPNTPPSSPPCRGALRGTRQPLTPTHVGGQITLSRSALNGSVRGHVIPWTTALDIGEAPHPAYGGRPEGTRVQVCLFTVVRYRCRHLQPQYW